jgi:hypothetical protein
VNEGHPPPPLTADTGLSAERAPAAGARVPTGLIELQHLILGDGRSVEEKPAEAAVLDRRTTLASQTMSMHGTAGEVYGSCPISCLAREKLTEQ